MAYDVKLKCNNCGMENTFSVEEGVLVKNHLRRKSEPCFNCGFRLLCV